MSTAALSALTPGTQVDWVVSAEFAELLDGHPAIRKVWPFKRASGFRGWIRFCRQLWEQGYEEIWDLHSTLRTYVARVVFSWLSFTTRRRRFSWRTISKDRFRLYGYFIFKKLWPVSLRPWPWVVRYSRFAGGSGSERPDLSYLVGGGEALPVAADSFICLMPGSKWRGKEWGPKSYAQVVSSLGVPAVVLGAAGEQASLNLVRILEEAGREVHSGVGLWKLRETARVLARALAYLGNDTGLAHLAEAVGTPAHVVFGPTHPGMGFGPWRRESTASRQEIWCQPCSKDGRFCIRIDQPYACMKRLSPEKVRDNVQASVSDRALARRLT